MSTRHTIPNPNEHEHSFIEQAHPAELIDEQSGVKDVKSTIRTPMEFYEEMSTRPDAREILERLAKL